MSFATRDDGIPAEISFGDVPERPPSPVPMPELPDDDEDVSIFSFGGLESVGSSMFKNVLVCFSGGRVYDEGRDATSLAQEQARSSSGIFADHQLMQTTSAPLKRQKRFGGLEEMSWFNCDPSTQLPLDPSMESDEEELSFKTKDDQDLGPPLFSDAAAADDDEEEEEDPIMLDRLEIPIVPRSDKEMEEAGTASASLRSSPSLLDLREGSTDEKDDGQPPTKPKTAKVQTSIIELKRALKEADAAYVKDSFTSTEPSKSTVLAAKLIPPFLQKAFRRTKSDKTNTKFSRRWRRIKKKLRLFGGARTNKKEVDTTALLSSSSCSSLHSDDSSTQRLPGTPVRNTLNSRDDSSKSEGTMTTFLELIEQNGESPSLDDHSCRKLLLESALRSRSKDLKASPIRGGRIEEECVREFVSDDEETESLKLVSEVHHPGAKKDGASELLLAAAEHEDPAKDGSFPRFSSFEELMKWIKVTDGSGYDAAEAYQFEKELEKLSTEELAGLLDDELEKMLHGLQE